MTAMQEHSAEPMPDALASTSRDLGLELLGLRLNGAQLGTMLGVSRQAVSSAVKRGTIAPPGPDGLFDARRAVREWMANSDPARVRARALKPGADAIAELREHAQGLAEEVSRLREALAAEREQGDMRVQAATWKAEDEAARSLCRFTDALLACWAEACTAADAGRLPRWLDELAAVDCGADLDEDRCDFPEDDGLDEYRRNFPEDDGAETDGTGAA